MNLWDVSILRAAEYTFIVCIPIAFWMAEKINELNVYCLNLVLMNRFRLYTD